MVSRGEIWWYESPGSRRRPVCVLTREVALPVLERILVVPATRTVRGIPTEVPLDRDDGMPERCVLSFDNVRTVRKAHLTERITKLGPDRMRDLCRALEIATGC